MEFALIRLAAPHFSKAEVTESVRWWASPSGVNVARAEGAFYAGAFSPSPNRKFEVLDSRFGRSREENFSAVDRILAGTPFVSIVTEQLVSTLHSQSCLPSSQSIEWNCAGLADSIGIPQDYLAEANHTLLQNEYLELDPPDLAAYEAFLARGNDLARRKLLEATSTVLQQAWRTALRETDDAISENVRSLSPVEREALLRGLTADIDQGKKLRLARTQLRSLQQTDPRSPDVLLQLARVTLKGSPDLPQAEIPPYVPRIDEAALDAAQRLLEQAVAIEPRQVEVVVLLGQIAYLKHQYPQSLALLERAQAIGTDSPWLAVNLGNTLYALALTPVSQNRDLALRAVAAYEAVLARASSVNATTRAVHQLGPLYASMGELMKAEQFYQRWVSLQQGVPKAYAQHRYANLLIYYTHRVDESVTAARQAVWMDPFPLAKETLAEALAIQAASLQGSGRVKEAAAALAEGQTMVPDLESLCPDLAHFPSTLPGVFGIHAGGLAKDFSGPIGGKTLVYASMHASGKDLEQLMAWGADPNYFDADEGTALHRAILSDNLDGVRVLLEHGANARMPFVDGRAPSELTNEESAKRVEILALVRKAAGEGGGAAGTSKAR
jgi:tetratricopeptide (TPR) repeat protein